MARLPAVCDRCGAFFPSPVGIAPGTTTATVFGTVVNCPRCGGPAHIPDGVYEFTESAIRLVSGPKQSVSDLTRLAAILREAKERRASLEEIRQEVATQVPRYQQLSICYDRGIRLIWPFTSPFWC